MTRNKKKLYHILNINLCLDLLGENWPYDLMNESPLILNESKIHIKFVAQNHMGICFKHPLIKDSYHGLLIYGI